MKLWKKLSLICGTVLVAILAIAALAQFSTITRNFQATTRQQASEKQARLVSDFCRTARLYRQPDDSPAVQRSILQYCFAQCNDGTGVLVWNGENLTGKKIPQPKGGEVITDAGTANYFAAEDGKSYFVIGSKTDLIYSAGSTCMVYTVVDVTNTVAQIREMAIQNLGISLLCIALGLCLIILMVRRSMKPMEALQKTAGEIANGNYAQRAEVKTHDEVGALAIDFNHMASAVQAHIEAVTEAAEKQRLFVGAVTHEFKTPLTGILLNVDNLQNLSMSQEQQEDALSAIDEQAQWLERMVQKMLQLLTVSNQFSPVTLSASALCRKAAAGARGILREREVALNTQCEDFPIRGDMDLLQSALVNLIDNASKASQSGQAVILRAENGRISVMDQGCGIPAESLPHITDAFYMADKSRSKRRGGVGLGMALVQEIVNVHGAKLHVESTEGTGTIVSIDFPT